MGKLIISTHITVDGVIGPSPGDWAILEGEGERYKFDQLLAADAFLLGRKVYEGLASAWPTITDDTGFAERVNSIPKRILGAGSCPARCAAAGSVWTLSESSWCAPRAARISP